MTSYIHEIYNESGPNMAAMKAVLHNLYFLVTLIMKTKANCLQCCYGEKHLAPPKYNAFFKKKKGKILFK